MDAAVILLILAAAGQAGWTPERSAPPPVGYDRYAQTPATSGSSVAPPPGVVDRTRSAISESGKALRDGFEAGVDAANRQLQDWSNSAESQIQSTGNNLRGTVEQSLVVPSTSAPRYSNPFETPPAQPASPRSRGSLAPPPWNDPAATSVPSWDSDATEPGPVFGQIQPQGSNRIQKDGGWTSIGSQVAAPPLLVPPLRRSPTATQSSSLAANGGSSIDAPTVRREPVQSLSNSPVQQEASPVTGADSWATGWGGNASAAPATIGRSGEPSVRGTSHDISRPTLQTANTQPQQSSPQQAGSSWADLWGEQDPWDNQQQTPSGAAIAGQATQLASNAAASVANNSEDRPLLAAPANGPNVPVPSLGDAQAAGGAIARRGTSSPADGANQPPWLPLLVVSLSLAGSLGANLFLGWSYLDARQKYRTLVRKTAEKFRRAVAA